MAMNLSGDPGPWRLRPVFISSTFRDMHAERDWLRERVFPEIAERLGRNRYHLEPIDLRQGVETIALAGQESRELKVLKVCLAEIDRSRPFLIVLLGDRYGWIPPEDRIAAAAQEAGYVTDLTGKSVTAMEIEFGILKKNADQRRRSFFYFREPLPYAEMPEEVAARFSDAHSAHPGERAGHDRLEALKRRIEEDPELGPRVRQYRAGWDPLGNKVVGLEGWGHQVLEDLWGDLEAETRAFAGEQPVSWQAQERALLEEFVEHRSRDFTGRGDVIRRLLDLARPARASSVDAVRGVCLTGGPGSGKSALFARFYRLLQGDESVLLLGHAAGTGPRSAQIDGMLRRWTGELEKFLGVQADLPDNATADEMDNAFASMLGLAGQGRRVVLLVDALDQFEPGPRSRHVTWIRPECWPENVFILATALPGPEAEAMSQRAGIERMELPGLTREEAGSVGVGVWSRYHRECSPDVLDVVLAKETVGDGPSHANPLWMTLAMEQLNLLDADDFERAGQNLHELVLGEARLLPAEVEGSYAAMMARTEKVFGAEWARPFACLIAVSRQGWREQDLHVMLPKAAVLLCPDRPEVAWDALEFAALRRGFRAHLVQRGGQGQWDFFHSQARQALQKMHLGDEATLRRLHGLVADHLIGLPEGDPLRISETMFHLIGADDRLRAARFYARAEEPAEATRTLCLHVLASADAARNPGLAWTISLLEQPSLDQETACALCFRLQGYLDESLETEGHLSLRKELLEAVQHTVAGYVQSDPADADWQHALSVNHMKLGDVLRAKGDLSGGLQALRKALAVGIRIKAADPSGSGQWKMYIVALRQRIGDGLRAQGDLAGASRAYQEALAVMQRLTQADPSDAESRMALSVCQEKLGDVFFSRGDLAGAQRAYREALVEREHLAKSDPSNDKLQRGMSVSKEKLGDVLKAQGDLVGALRAYREALGVSRRLTQSDPSNTGWQLDLSESLVKLGEALSAQGDLAEALRAYQEALAVSRRLAQSDPSNAGWQRELVLVHIKLGEVLDAQGDLAGAFRAYREALESSQRLALSDPSNAAWQRDLAVCHQKLAVVARRQGDDAGYMSEMRACFEVLDDMRRRDIHFDPELAQSYKELAEVFSK
jgi:tetratricopeptide (TPR) repeat protein